MIDFVCRLIRGKEPESAKSNDLAKCGSSKGVEKSEDSALATTAVEATSSGSQAKDAPPVGLVAQHAATENEDLGNRTPGNEGSLARSPSFATTVQLGSIWSGTGAKYQALLPCLFALTFLGVGVNMCEYICTHAHTHTDLSDSPLPTPSPLNAAPLAATPEPVAKPETRIRHSDNFFTG